VIFVSALVLGIITGMRSMLGPAFVSWAVWLGMVDVRHSPFAFMGFHYTHIILTVLAIGELIGDKLPSAPSRKTPVPFVGRVLCGALCGATLGTGGQSLAFLLLLGVMGAIVGTMFGYIARMRLAAIMQRDLTAALLEDAVAIALGCLCLAALRQVS
jgi:uncharacterized membrane protein